MTLIIIAAKKTNRQAEKVSSDSSKKFKLHCLLVLQNHLIEQREINFHTRNKNYTRNISSYLSSNNLGHFTSLN